MNISIKNKQLLASVLLTGIVLNSIPSLPWKKPHINMSFSKNDSIESVMRAISNHTDLDDNYSIQFTNANNSESTSLEDINNQYNEAYQNGQLDVCNKKLYQIGYFLLKQQVADTLGIEMSQIQDFSYKIDDIDHHVYEYKVIITYEQDAQIKTQELSLTDEGPRIIINLERARVGGFDPVEEVDACYTSFLEFMTTSGEIKGDKLVITYDEAKQLSVVISNL